MLVNDGAKLEGNPTARIRQLDQQHAAVGQVWLSFYRPPLFKRVEQAGDAGPVDDQPVCDMVGRYGRLRVCQDAEDQPGSGTQVKGDQPNRFKSNEG
jgi:hypothetical protein